MRTLSSYLQDSWVQGSDDGRQLFDAVTEEPVAVASTAGLDLGAALAHLRRIGGPALRGMTFAERGEALKGMSKVIHGHRDELIELAQINSGNTRSDAKFDIDGGMGTLAYYGGVGRSMGDAKWLLDGDQEPILRSKRMVGQHLWLPRRGTAIHINAFNFPVWGMCEKLAVSMLAGVPAMVKPATATALVSVRLVELWVEAGVIPAGSLALLTGSVGDLLDHVGAQDVVTFTGSGDTGRKIKTHPAVVRHNVPVNIEADSLNAAVLGPDVELDSDTFQMFLADVSRDITQKAGQKCTAIRRVLVPADRLDDVVEALGERLGDAGVGDPRQRVNRVGPLATASQKRDILAGIASLEAVCPRVWGDPTAVPDGGYYVAPQLFLAEGGVDAPYVHEHEVFGPVAAILPWSGSASEAVDIIAAGGGGLVASVYTDDVDWGGEVVLGIAPWSGRVMWGSRKVHDQGAGPGTVLPGFVHGGPGKAGGGEELGGERGLRFYWQRTALQGDRGLLQRILR